ncbi:MAG: 2-oxoglutarate and iron-dependent oxygenase domain-containing protein [Pseudomonadota bacterium]|nr:2-oxoglutarate and iron-dependent oxygenase domain-containing protein [Pseudomonadota bacterium]
MTGALPVIDLAPLRLGDEADRRAVAQQISAACTGSGFFCITGHGVDETLIADTRRAAVDFFARPVAEKMKVARPPEKISRGYFPFADRSLAYSRGVAALPDLQEAWAMGPPDRPDVPYYHTETAGRFFAPNHWPEIPTGFEAILREYYATLSDLSATLMRGFALALDLDGDFFADKTDRPSSVARLIRYPAQDAAPETGQLRAGAHSDYGALTILRGDRVAGALQVQLPSGGWIDVDPPDGALVCNIGDAMAYWTGERWNSTLHRVANPPGNVPHGDRISLVFFYSPNYDAVLGGINDAPGATPPSFAEHYLDKVMKAAHGRLSAGAKDAAI